MSVVVITPPAQLVDLDLAKKHLRVDDGDSDDLIGGYIAAASSALDGPYGWLQRAIGVQTLELRLDSFGTQDWRVGDGYAWSGGWAGEAWDRWPFGRISLRCPPLIAIQSITYEDSTGLDQVLTSDGWVLDGDGVEPAFGEVWPSGRVAANAVRIRYTAGYAPLPVPPGSPDGTVGASTVPSAIIQATLLMVGDFWAKRGRPADRRPRGGGRQPGRREPAVALPCVGLMPAIGEMRDRYTFQPPGSTATGGDGIDRSTPWNVGAQVTVWAATQYLRGTEAVQQARLEGDQPVILTIRASSATRAIDNTWRALNARDGSRVFDIKSMSPNAADPLAFLDILAVQKRGQQNGGS